ncbi:MAG: DUF2726 domain-containing protein [Rhodocyclaceae bacterium]
MVWLVLAVTVVAVLLLMAKQKQSQGIASGYPYKKLPTLFTPAECSFFGVLDQAVGKDFRLFGKVRVADVLAPRDGMNKSLWQTAFNKINRKHFDFLLCAPGDLSVLCAIELNDQSHKKKNRQDRDEFLAGACTAAGVPLISFQARHAYSAAEVSAKIVEAISGSSTPASRPLDVKTAADIRQAEPSQISGADAAPICPRCAGSMLKRTAKGGANAGQQFWGCANFPTCLGIVKL